MEDLQHIGVIEIHPTESILQADCSHSTQFQNIHLIASFPHGNLWQLPVA